jgi:uncharacterized protein YecE (DUF72 family)
MSAEVRIGTSGWQYQHWKGNFYDAKLPASRMLGWYLRHFDTVELNNSFYKLPSPEAFDKWRASTPSDFVFAVKASRFITHMKKLKDPENALNNLLPRAARLREKLGPILFQLPPGWRVDAGRLRDFLHALPATHRYAFEFRETSWHSDAILQLLHEYNAAFCIFELAGFQSAIEVTANFTYVRLHGPGGKYQGCYPAEALDGWARRIVRWQRKLSSIYVYFDNDQAGYAAKNALQLRERVMQSQHQAA